MGILGNMISRFFEKSKYVYIAKFKGEFAMAVTRAENVNIGIARIVLIDKDYKEILDTKMQCLLSEQCIIMHNGYLTAWKCVTAESDDNFTEIQLDRTAYILDKNLEKAVDTEDYSEIIWLESGAYDVLSKKTKKHGMLDKKFKLIMEEKCDSIKKIGKDKYRCIYTLENGNQKMEVYDFSKKEVIIVPGEIINTATFQKKEFHKFKMDGMYGYYDEKINKFITNEYDKLSNIGCDGIISYVKGNNEGSFHVSDAYTHM